MKVLVINSGSSSIKFQVIDMPSELVICKGLAERIGIENSIVHYSNETESLSKKVVLKDHRKGLEAITDLLMNEEVGILNNSDEISLVAHRVVHGGNKFDRPILIDDEVLSEIKRLSMLAPLHNPANAIGIEVAKQIFKEANQVAVFDTAFHQTLPEIAYRYAIPKTMADQNHIRIYGFHGTSHKYVCEKAIQYLEKKFSKMISVHLGNGCSMTAVKDGKSIDHSLGFGPSNGLIMGTRSGDIDQSVIFYLMDRLQMTSSEVNDMLNKKSGLLGLTGHSDLREIQSSAEAGDTDCQLALRMMAYRIKKYIGSYFAILNGLDALIFTGGIGENSATLRQMVCENLDAFGIKIDATKNEQKSDSILEIQKEGSDVNILVIPTNEELEIAKQACILFKGR